MGQHQPLYGGLDLKIVVPLSTFLGVEEVKRWLAQL